MEHEQSTNSNINNINPVELDNQSIKEFIKLIFFPGQQINIARIEEPEPDDKKAEYRSKNFNITNFPNIKDLPGWGTFTSPNPCRVGTQRADKNLATIQTIFIDFDSDNNDVATTLKKLNTLTVAPNIISKRSEKNQHFYYLIEPVEPTNLNIIKYKAIVEYFIKNHGADKIVKVPSGLLRLPETIRYKDDKRQIYKWTMLKEKRYNIDDILEILDIKVTEEIKKEQGEIVQKIHDFDPVIHIFNRHKNLHTENKYQTGTKETEETAYLYRMGLECRDWGLSNDQALEIAFELNDIIFEPSVKEHIIRHQIDSAYRYAKNEPGLRRAEWEEQSDLKAQKKYLANIYEEERVREKLKDYCFVLNSMILVNKKRYTERYTNKEHFAAFLVSKINTILSINKIKLKGLIHIVDKMDFRPDVKKQEFVDIDGLTCLNRYLGIPFEKTYIEYKNNKSENAQKGLKLFLNHIKYLTNNEYEYKTLITYFAHKLQKPEIKIPWAPLLISTQTGTGRSWLYDLMYCFLKEYTCSVTHNNLKFGYTQYKEDKVFIFIHEIKDSDNYSFLESFKEQITEKDFMLDSKYTRTYRMTDCINYIFFSNHFDALKIDNTDRRLFVVLNMKLEKEQDYYDAMYSVLYDNEQLSAIYEYLKTFDLSDFNPFKRPQLTEGKKLMIETTATELYLFLDEMRNDENNPVFNKPFVIGRDIQNYIQTNGSEIIRKKVSEKQIKIYLLKNNYVEVSLQRRIEEHRIHKKVWVAPDTNIDSISNSDIIQTLGMEVMENKEF